MSCPVQQFCVCWGKSWRPHPLWDLCRQSSEEAWTDCDLRELQFLLLEVPWWALEYLLQTLIHESRMSKAHNHHNLSPSRRELSAKHSISIKNAYNGLYNNSNPGCTYFWPQLDTLLRPFWFLLHEKQWSTRVYWLLPDHSRIFSTMSSLDSENDGRKSSTASLSSKQLMQQKQLWNVDQSLLRGCHKQNVHDQCLLQRSALRMRDPK